ncbi:hypothetical protein PQS31_01590 [Luteimonas sp BLCC-B24]|uniref:hypothetical protein n=1 Tax=Luteimonas sp. BLCC-B24 TaxID=3025317 RepID=UPI00234DDCE5|nr:hypothetical protein [Luteimonas sp. BLCC-B24]MDC7805523.1 hypothetical protein [Luteimonas sp. BLCC-B24]
MSQLPEGVCIRLSDFSETFDPSVERTEMERGVPKQRVLNTQVMVKLSCTLMFVDAAQYQAFEDWYFDTIKRIGWFTAEHPRTKQLISCRFEGGSIGTLQVINHRTGRCARSLVLEYLR